MKTPVLVLGWIPRIVLTVARSLHGYGVPVDLAHWTKAPPVRSAAVDNFIRLPSPNISPTEFLANIRSLIKHRGYDVLIPADDTAIAAILEHYDELQPLLRIACPPPEITRRVLCKESTLQAGQKCGIPVPRSVAVSHSSELADIVHEIPFPWFLKPAEKETRFEEFTGCRIDTLEDIPKTYPTVRKFETPMLVQEFCEGIGVGVEVLLHRGKCLAVFQHRRLMEFSYTGGVAVTAIAEQPDSTLVDHSLALLRELEWDGVAMVEFRMNPRSGEAVLMEVNGRYWGTVSLPVSMGIDFPLYHWQVLHGEVPAIPADYVPGQHWRFTVGYLHRLFQLIVLSRKSRPARAELKRTLVQVPKDFGPIVKDAVFSSSDPMPAILELAQQTASLSRYSVKALLNRVPNLSKQVSSQKSTAF